MTISLDNRPELVEPAARIILGAIDLGDGGTEKQRHLLQSIVSKVWERPDLDISDLADLPPGTLGREYFDFYCRNSFDLPGEGHGSPSFFVRHDMCHIIAGYGPTSPEELALTAFHVGMNDNELNWNLLIVALAALEVGIFNSENFEAKMDILDRDGALELMVEGFVRGSHCSGDFSTIDHLAEAHCTVEELRERFGVSDRQL